MNRFFYASMFDDICTAKTTYQIKPSWTFELKDQLPYWQALWDKVGMRLLEATTQLVGRPFVQRNFQVALSLCSFPSNANSKKTATRILPGVIG